MRPGVFCPREALVELRAREGALQESGGVDVAVVLVGRVDNL